MKPKFDTDFEYDTWFDREQQRELLEGYFGEDKKEVIGDGKGI